MIFSLKDFQLEMYQLKNSINGTFRHYIFPNNYSFVPENFLLKCFFHFHYVENFQKWKNYYTERAELVGGKDCQKQKLNYLN